MTPTTPLRRTFVLLLAPALWLPMVARPARAAWPHDPTVNVPVCTAISNQTNPVIASDGAGGAIVAWSDVRSGPNSDIYAQRVNAAGVAQWTTDGVAVASGAGDQSLCTIVSDGGGGAIIAWQDNRGGNFDIYAQRLNASGVPQWTANGVALCTATADQQVPKIASDGAAGAIVVWQDTRNGNTDVYAQRVSAAGVPQWTANGVAVCTVLNTQSGQAIVADGAGGAVFVWQDGRSGTNDIYAQRANAAGTLLWPANGVSVCSAANNQNSPALIADGSGGAIVTWYDFRTGANPDIYVQHVNALGSQQWGLDGAPVCVDPNVQQFPAIASDGSGGAIVAWQDARNGSGDIYAQHMSAGGTAQWTVDGVPVCTAANNQANATVVSDGAGGAIVAWYDQRTVIANDIYAQRLNAAGVTQWTANGVAISTANADQINEAIVADGAGGAIAAWQDSRNSGAPDIYAQRVEHFGYLGNPEPVSAGIHDVPNDQGGRVKVSFYPSWLDGVSDPNLAAYDIYRSAPGSTARAALRAGAHALDGFGEVPPAAGRSFVLLPDGVDLYAWEYLGTVNPVHFLSAYGYIASTTGDSIGGSNPLTAFMIVARNASGSMYWLSAPDSGYSVDNLPPVAPAPFTGAYSAGATHLHWGANSETDLAGYRVYRGASSSFTPGPSSLIASPADTGYVDVGAAGSWYKLSAVDAHGNESPFATLGPDGTTAAPGAAAALWLSAANPVPAAGGAIRFSLARAGRAALALYDASGRRVRTLVDGTLAAGVHGTALALRDDAGRSLPGGLYFLRLVTREGTRVARVAALP